MMAIRIYAYFKHILVGYSSHDVHKLRYDLTIHVRYDYSTGPLFKPSLNVQEHVGGRADGDGSGGLCARALRRRVGPPDGARGHHRRARADG